MKRGRPDASEMSVTQLKGSRCGDDHPLNRAFPLQCVKKEVLFGNTLRLNINNVMDVVRYNQYVNEKYRVRGLEQIMSGEMFETKNTITENDPYTRYNLRWDNTISRNEQGQIYGVGMKSDIYSLVKLKFTYIRIHRRWVDDTSCSTLYLSIDSDSINQHILSEQFDTFM